MKQIESNQRNVNFSFCESPVTIDKSAAWGEGNLQNFPNGVFLKHDASGDVTHGVQPKEDMSAPIGWLKDENGFKKLPIWIGERLAPGTTKNLLTLDGPIDYLVAEDSFVCCNDSDGIPNMKDSWVQSVAEINKNYIR